MVVTFVYPVYLESVVCAGLGNLGDLLWGINGSSSLIVVALLAPILGAVADLSGRKKRFLVASVGALCLSSVQSVSRSMVALMVPREQQAEIFGFYGTSGELSSA